MARATTRTTGRKQQLAITRFLARHQMELAENENLLAAAAIAGGAYSGRGLTLSSAPEHVALREAWYASPGRRLMEELKSYWRTRLLKDAMEENNPGAYREILERWLIELIGRVPNGVLIPLRGTPGNSSKKETADIHRIWIAKGRCTPTQLAIEVYDDFLRLAPKQRDRLAKRCAAAAKRHDKKLASVMH